MGATATIQTLVPAARLRPCVPLRGRATNSHRTDDGLAAYRSLVDGLATRFPVTRRMIGREAFGAMAHRFISERSVVATGVQNWEAFPSFLRSQSNAASIEYVADIAKLEMAQGKARDAADALPLRAQGFQSLLRTERPEALRLVLHPSVFLVASRFPVVTLWDISQSDDVNRGIDRWGAECALVARPFLEVQVRRLPPGGCAFIRALSQGRTLAAAFDAGIAADPRFDIPTDRALLLEANVVTGIRERARVEQPNA